MVIYVVSTVSLKTLYRFHPPLALVIVGSEASPTYSSCVAFGGHDGAA